MASSRLNLDPATIKSKQNCLLVWVDGTVHEATVDTKITLEKLRSIVPDVQLVNHPDKAIDLLTNTNNKTSFVITSGAFGQQLVPRIHSLGNLDAIYIFCQNVKFHSEWSKEWRKVTRVDSKIDSICEALRQAVVQCYQDDSSMVFIDFIDDNNLNQLPASFMYTTLLKDALLNMKPEPDKELNKFCDNARDKYASQKINRSDFDQYKGHYQDDIEEFRKTYKPNQAIAWYTKETCIYSMMNDGLRYLQGDVIVDLGFFIHDLHHQLVQLHQKQSEEFGNKEFIVYRGQALPKIDLERFQKKKGGLFGFNNFLSTSLKPEKSMEFAERNASKLGCVGVLFKMKIDPRSTQTPYAIIKDFSYYKKEEEVLFGMHALFRTGDTRLIGNGEKLIYEIELKLTADDDPQLTRLTKHMSDNIRAGWNWHRIGWILVDMNQLDKAEEIYMDLLKENLNIRDKGTYNHQLGRINEKRGNYDKALDYYQQSLKLKQQLLPDTHPDLATPYNNIGLVYNSMGDYTQALSYYLKALAIQQKALPEKHCDLAISYNNIGLVYNNMSEYSKALSYYEKSLSIYKETLPDTHPLLGQSYHNIGCVHYSMKKYPLALEYLEKALRINVSTLAADHPSISLTRQWIAATKKEMNK